MTKLSTNLKKFKLITFDATDTLIKFKKPPQLEYAKAAEKFGYFNIDQQRISNSFRTTFTLMNQNYPNFGRNDDLDWQKWWTKIVYNVFKNSNTKIEDKHLHGIAEYLINLYKSDKAYTKINKSQILIERLCGIKKNMGIISNFDPRIKDIIAAMQYPKFDFIVNSYDAGCSKPDKEIFNYALNEYSKFFNYERTIEPHEALHIGNKPDLDYLGALSAGWSSILIQDNDEILKHFIKINKNHVFPSLEEFYSDLHNTDILW